MQVPHCDQSTDDRMDISAGMEITKDCVGQTYFEFMTETETKTNNHFLPVEDSINNEQIL